MSDANTPFPLLPEHQDLILFSLNVEKFDEFTAMLDALPNENQGLARLMAVKAPWGTDKA